MKKHTLKRYLASLLAVLMLISVTGISPAVFADSYEQPVLQSGSAVIANADITKQVLAKTLISNYDKCDPSTRDNLDWQYYCTGKRVGVVSDEYKDDWVSINGESRKHYKESKKVLGITTTIDTYYTFSSLYDNSYGTYQVRIGSGTAVSFTKLEPQTLQVTLNDNVTVVMPYTGATSVDYAVLEQRVLDAAIKSTNYTLTRGNTSITYYASPPTGSVTDTDKNWVPLAGGEAPVLGIPITYNGVPEGTQKVKLSFKGEGAYTAKDIELNVTFTGRQDASYMLKDSPSVGLKYTDATNIDYSTINEDVFNAVFSGTTPQLSASDVTITYWASLKTGSWTDEDKDWMPLTGGKKTVGIDYEYAAVTEGTHKVRIVWGGNANYNGFTVEKEVSFTGREDVPAVDPSSFEVKAAFNADQSLNYESIRQAIWAQVKDKLPSNITYDKVSFAFKYEFAITYWLTFEGSAADLDFDTAIFGDANPRLELGENTIRVKWAGDSQYNPYEQQFTVNVVDGREATDISFKDSPKVKITYDDDVNIKLDELYAAIWENVVDSITPAELDKNSISIKYYATAETGSLGKLGHAWANLNGETISALTYPAISEGTWKLRFEYAGSVDYNGFSKEVDVEFIGRDPAFALKDGVKDSVTEVSLKFADAENYNYEVTAQNIREALLSQLGDIDLSEVKVQYRPIATDVKDLDFQPSTVFGKAFGEGEFTVVLSWGGDKGTALYKPFSAEVKVKMVDNRIQSVVAYVENASITFNMVGDEMLQAIFNNVIDKTNSTLPEGLTYKDFTYEYKIVTVYKVGDRELQKEEWVPIVGDDGYPNMNADEENGQTIRISYKGNADYKGCANEGNVTVMKADVKVSVKRLTIMHVGDTELPDNFITLDPNDTRSIEVYTFFVGVNTNKETTVYLMLPESKTQLIEAISKAQNRLGISPTLEEQLNDGMTIGELRAALDSIVNSPILNNKLGQMAFDGFMKFMGYNFTYAQFKSLYDTMSQIASLADDLRLAIGSPSHAGIYQAIAVTVSDNYNRAYGTGTVLVLMTWKDVKLQKNSVLGDSNTITASQAEQLKGDNNLCVLTRNGNELSGEYVGNIHYWFTGVNRIYARSEMPTTPGKYIVTASVRGGDYYATPKTFIFTITAD